jgi:K+ transporter
MATFLRPSPPRFRDQHLSIALGVTLVLAAVVLVSNFTPVKIMEGGWIVALVALAIFYFVLVLHYRQKRWLFDNGINVLAELAASAAESFSIRYQHDGVMFEQIVEVTPEARKRLYSGGKIVLRMHPRRPQCVQYLREFDTPSVLASLNRPA